MGAFEGTRWPGSPYRQHELLELEILASKARFALGHFTRTKPPLPINPRTVFISHIKF